MINALYETPQDHRVLQISFAVDIADGRYVHESRLGANEAELREVLEVRPDWVPEKVVLLDGHVSILYRGQELLGSLWWIEFVWLTGLGELIEGGRSTQKLNNSSGQFVEFMQSGPSVAMSLHDHGNVRKRPNLPFNEFVAEWGLMATRSLRVRAELGGQSEQFSLASYFDREFGPLSWQSQVPMPLLEYTVRAPLGEVLSNPVPQLD